MWLEKVRLKRKLASPHAAVRIKAIENLNADSDRTIIIELASTDIDAGVRSAAIRRCREPEILQQLLLRENDPQVLELLRIHSDNIYGELALQSCSEDQENDAFNHISSPDTLIKVALQSNSPHLILAAGARLSQQQEIWIRLLEQLSDDKLALELYNRNMPDPESAAAAHLLNCARSQELRKAIAAERARSQAHAMAYQKELQWVEEAEAALEQNELEKFEYLNDHIRSVDFHHEILKKRFLAARYRYFRAREEQLARQQADARDRQMAAELFRQLTMLKDSGNWKMIRQCVENWNRCQLSQSRGAVDFQQPFTALAAELTERFNALQQRNAAVLSTAQKVLQNYEAMLSAQQLPSLEQRQVLLNELESALSNLPEIPLEITAIREKILNIERHIRYRARQEAQKRDLERWEHYTRKLDICADLERLITVADDNLPEAAKTFRTMREHWNSLGPVPAEKANEIRDRYHNLCNIMHGRLEKFFSEREQQRQQALATKTQLLAEAEKLSGHDDWSETSNRLKELQNLWKSAGSAGGAQDRELFERFHNACNAFFVRRNAVWEERKRSFMAASQRKKELCDAAEALQNQPFEKARNEIAALREAWRNLPSAGKDDRLLYMQFNRAIENIFASHREAEDEVRQQAEILCTDLADILKNARSGHYQSYQICKALQDNQQRWSNISGHPPRNAEKKYNELLDILQKEICSLHHQESRHKLDSTEQLEAVITPTLDEEKLIDHLSRRLKVCGELEDRLKECRIISGNGDLAGELQQAIAGNFGGGAYRLTIPELDEFLQRFVAVGHVPPDARTAVFDRFRTLYNRALEVLQSEADQRSTADLPEQ